MTVVKPAAVSSFIQDKQNHTSTLLWIKKMEIPAIHQELGKFVVLFQTMDNAINDLIIEIAGNKQFIVEAFIAKTEFSAKMEIADVIFTHFIDITANTDEDEKEKFHSLMNRCKKIGQERNVIVHSVYYPLTKVDGTKRLIAKSQNIWLESPRIVTPKIPVTPRYPARNV
jgi:predicted metalloendopeptidase